MIWPPRPAPDTPAPLAPADLPVGMTEIEERLRGPDGAAFREELLETLDREIEAIRVRLAEGLPPDEYARATTIGRALAAARDIVLAFPST